MIDAVDRLSRIRDRLQRCLHDEVLPFWMRHGLADNGTINTVLSDDGALLGRGVWLWSQWRAVWVFSRLYRHTSDEQYLSIARRIAAFCYAHGWDDAQGGWRLCVTHDGRQVRGTDSLYTDGFAMYGLAEYIRATNGDDATAIRWARQTAGHVRTVLQGPHDQIPHFPYPIPHGMRVHGLPMMFNLNFFELGRVLMDEQYLALADTLGEEVRSQFYRPDRDLILERVQADGSEGPSPLGTVVVPGHVVESMWFQLDTARGEQRSATQSLAIRMIRRHMELGWDHEHGGLFLAVDADDRPAVGWSHATAKLWWPHTEAMVALLRAFETTGKPWCLDWYDAVHDYAFAHFPHPTAGEWRQRLDRFGRPMNEVVALPVKDPFHLPRALILCLETIERMQARQPSTEHRPA